MTLKVCESMASSSRIGVDLPEIVSGKKKHQICISASFGKEVRVLVYHGSHPVTCYDVGHSDH